MKKVIFNGEPGERWTNDGPRVMYQFVAELRNTCGACLSYHMAVSGWWPLPLHRNCRCKMTPVRPGMTAEPWVDFRKILDAMDPSQKRAAVGASAYRLLKRGVIKWADVVTGSRVRTLREVVARNKITVDAMTKAGVREPIAKAAWLAVNTPELAIAKAHRKALMEALDAAGVKRDKVVEAAAEALVDRIVVQGIDLGGAAGKAAKPPKIGPDDLIRLLGLNKEKTKAAVKPKPKPKPKPKADPESKAKPEPKRVVVEWKGDVTREDAEWRLAAIAEEIPKRVMDRLAEFGAKFIYVGKLEDELGDEVHEHPRGWAEGATWANAEGFYDPAKKIMVVAKTYVGRLSGKTVESSRSVAVACHEAGHAIDHAFGQLSKTKEFLAAYGDDKAGVKSEDRGGVEYLLQDGDAGPSEAFAELSAYLFANPMIRRNMNELFPKTVKWLRDFYGLSGNP